MQTQNSHTQKHTETLRGVTLQMKQERGGKRNGKETSGRDEEVEEEERGRKKVKKGGRSARQV